MNPNIDYIELEDLLNNRVSEETQKTLEQEIATDESFAEEFAFYKDLRKVVEYEGDANLAALIAQTQTKLTAEGFFASATQIATETQAPTTAKVRQLGTRRRYNALAIAASITLAVGIFGWWTVQQQFSSEALAFNNFEPDMQNALRSTEERPRTKIDEGLSAFQEGKYELAIEFFTAAEIQNDSFASTVAYYLGQTYFKKEQYDLAAEQFQIVVRANDIRFKDSAEWYEVLSDLAINKDVTAKVAAIAENENHIFSEQAKTLQNKLNSIWRKIAR
jgi:tetratricopeptide (TPR) repeat protein